MAGLTEAQIAAQITLLNTALTTALASPRPNYTIGGRTVAKADYIATLIDSISKLTAMSADIPSETVPTAIDYTITDTGSDNTQYEGDDND